MINWTIVASIIIGLSIYDLCKATSKLIYVWLKKGLKNEDN